MCRGHSHGFTLVELLVVIAVIGICVVLVVAHAAPDERAVLKHEAERLAQVLDLAANESRLTATTIHWTTDGRAYRFSRFSEEGGWSALGSDALRPRVLAEGVTVAGVRIENGGADTKEIMLRPFAPAPLFSISLAAASATARVESSPIGEIRVVSPDGR